MLESTHMGGRWLSERHWARPGGWNAVPLRIGIGCARDSFNMIIRNQQQLRVLHGFDQENDPKAYAARAPENQSCMPIENWNSTSRPLAKAPRLSGCKQVTDRTAYRDIRLISTRHP